MFVGLYPPFPAESVDDEDFLCWKCLNCDGKGIIAKKTYYLPNLRRSLQ